VGAAVVAGTVIDKESQRRDRTDSVMTTVLEHSTPTARAMPGPTGQAAMGRLKVSSLAISAATAALVWLAASELERSGRLGTTLAAGRAEIVAPLLIAVVVAMLVCERLWPAQQQEMFASGQRHDAWFLVLHIVAVVPLMTLLGVACALLLGGVSDWVRPSWTAALPYWTVVALALVLMDGCNWLAHWADHRINALWRLHALHHSQEEVNVLTSFRAHPLSHLAGFVLATVPAVVVMGDRPTAPILITVYICISTITHANVPWSFGHAGKLVVSPAYHRLHHARDDASGVNLGVVLTVWDVLARRAVFPEPGAPPCRTGLKGAGLVTEHSDTSVSNARLLLIQLVEPFTTKRVNGNAPSDQSS